MSETDILGKTQQQVIHDKFTALQSKVKVETAILVVTQKRVRKLFGFVATNLLDVTMTIEIETRCGVELKYPTESMTCIDHNFDSMIDVLNQICVNSSRAQVYTSSENVPVRNIAIYRSVDLETTPMALVMRE